MGDATANLFTKTSRVLRDTVILELQKSNDFLRRQLAQNTANPFFKYKVIVKQHRVPMQQGNIFPETEGVFISMKDYNVNVLLKNENNENVIKIFHLNNIKIVDDRIERFFFQ